MTKTQTVLVALASAAIGALMAVLVLRSGGKKDAEEKPKEAAPAEERVKVENGETVVTLDAATVAASHIVVAPLAAAEHGNATSTFATVLDAHDLGDARSQLASARAQTAQAKARVSAADAEVARLRALHADNRNISDRVLQEGEANARAEHANVDAAQVAERAPITSIEQKWGSAIARAFAGSAPWIDDVIANRSVLVAVVSPQQPPERITLQTQDGSATATFVAPSTHSDARVQGRSWLYLARGGVLTPGMSLTATIGRNATQQGALVPHDAVVWTAGRAWLYVETSPNTFARRPIDSSVPMNSGWFVTVPAAGTRVVVEGSGQLLSEEAKPKVEE